MEYINNKKKRKNRSVLEEMDKPMKDHHVCKTVSKYQCLNTPWDPAHSTRSTHTSVFLSDDAHPQDCVGAHAVTDISITLLLVLVWQCLLENLIPSYQTNVIPSRVLLSFDLNPRYSKANASKNNELQSRREKS